MFKKANMVDKYVGYFCKKTICKYLSIRAQSGHTDYHVALVLWAS